MRDFRRNLFAVGCIAAIAIAQAALWERTMEGHLVKDEMDEFEVRLVRGDYIVDLTGKNPRGDLDVYVYDKDDELVGSDELDDNNPIVQFKVTRSATYTIEVYNYGAVQAYAGSIYKE